MTMMGDTIGHLESNERNGEERNKVEITMLTKRAAPHDRDGRYDQTPTRQQEEW